jgi:hypothetical protein
MGIDQLFFVQEFHTEHFYPWSTGVTRSNGLMSDLVLLRVRHNTINKNWWTPTNASNDFWMNHVDAHRMAGVEATIYESADFTRIKDVSVGYDLPSNLVSRLWTEQTENLFHRKKPCYIHKLARS